jgi:hypothetical protein
MQLRRSIATCGEAVYEAITYHANRTGCLPEPIAATVNNAVLYVEVASDHAEFDGPYRLRSSATHGFLGVAALHVGRSPAPNFADAFSAAGYGPLPELEQSALEDALDSPPDAYDAEEVFLSAYNHDWDPE